MIRTAILSSMAAFTFLSSIAISEEVVNLYSARHYDTDDALYSNFQKETGIKVNLIEGGSDGLIERIINNLSPQLSENSLLTCKEITIQLRVRMILTMTAKPPSRSQQIGIIRSLMRRSGKV